MLILKNKKFLTITSFILIFTASLVTITIYNNTYNNTEDNNTSNVIEVRNPTTDNIITTVLDVTGYDGLKKINDEDISSYYSVPDGLITESTVYLSKLIESEEEVACFKLTDKTYIAQLEEVIRNHINVRLKTVNSNSDQYELLENYIVSQKDDFVFLSVGQNANIINATFENLILSY